MEQGVEEKGGYYGVTSFWNRFTDFISVFLKLILYLTSECLISEMLKQYVV